MFRFFRLNSFGEKVFLNKEPEVELAVRRENENYSKMFTILITALLGIALMFMGLDLDMKIVLATLKVNSFSSISVSYCSEETCWSPHRNG